MGRRRTGTVNKPGPQLALDLTDKPRSPLARKAPSLYDFRTGKWDHKGLRVNAVYRLLRKRVIGKARALELLAQRHSKKEMKVLYATIEIWRGPIPDMLP